MCDPLTIASAAAMAGGTLLKSNEATSNQAAAINAKNQGTADMLAKEQQLQHQSSGIFDQTLQPFQGNAPTENLQAAQGANTAALTANGPTATALAGGATTGNAPQVVQDSEKGTIANRISKLRASDAALGSLSGYDTNNSGIARGLQDSKSQLGTIGDFARQDANVGQALTSAAVANSQKAPSPFGDLLAGAGQVGMAAGAGGMPSLFGGSVKAGTNGVTTALGKYGTVSGATPGFSYGGYFG
jgi:hypothetical protein